MSSKAKAKAKGNEIADKGSSPKRKREDDTGYFKAQRRREDIQSSPKTPLSPEKPCQSKEQSRKFIQREREAALSVGQSLIPVDPLKGNMVGQCSAKQLVSETFVSASENAWDQSKTPHDKGSKSFIEDPWEKAVNTWSNKGKSSGTNDWKNPTQHATRGHNWSQPEGQNATGGWKKKFNEKDTTGINSQVDGGIQGKPKSSSGGAYRSKLDLKQEDGSAQHKGWIVERGYGERRSEPAGVWNNGSSGWVQQKSSDTADGDPIWDASVDKRATKFGSSGTKEWKSPSDASGAKNGGWGGSSGTKDTWGQSRSFGNDKGQGGVRGRDLSSSGGFRDRGGHGDYGGKRDYGGRGDFGGRKDRGDYQGGRDEGVRNGGRSFGDKSSWRSSSGDRDINKSGNDNVRKDDGGGNSRRNAPSAGKNDRSRGREGGEGSDRVKKDDWGNSVSRGSGRAGGSREKGDDCGGRGGYREGSDKEDKGRSMSRGSSRAKP